MNLTTLNNNTSINNQLFKNYIEFIDASPRTSEAYYRNLNRFYEWIQTQGITQPTRQDIIAYRNHLQETKTPNTVQAYLVAVRLFFKWTSTEGIYTNIAENIKSPKVSKDHKKDHLTGHQVKRVLDNIDQTTEAGTRDYAMLTLMFTAGLRTIEVSRLQVKDLGALGDASILYIHGKGRDSKDNYIKLAPAVEDIIRAYLSTKGKASEEDYIFTSTSNHNQGQGITTRTIRRIVKARFKAVGLDSDRLTAHSTRHTAITLALLAGSTVQEAQQFARHESITTTMIYAHNLEKINNTCSDNIANSIL